MNKLTEYDDKETKTKESESFICTGETTEENQTFDKGDNSRVPFDRGWAWMVLLGGVFSLAIAIGCFRTNGVLFVEFQRVFKSTSTVTSVITTINNIVFCISSLVVMTVGMKSVECRYIVLTGSVILCVSYVITGIATDITVVMISHGFIQDNVFVNFTGVGLACVEPTAASMVTKYFKKKRGLGNSLVSTGNSIGGLIFPPIVTGLFYVYGFMGCMLILGAIHLNVCVSAMLYRPLSFYNTRFSQRQIHHSSNEKKKKSASQGLHQLLLLFDFKLFMNPLFILFQLAFGMFATATMITFMYIPPLAKENNIDDKQAALLVAIFSGVDICGRIFYGVIADTNIFSRTTLVSVSGVIFGTSTICVRFFTTFELLVMHVIIVGATSGAMKSLYPGIIIEYLSIKYLDSTIGFAMLMMGLSDGIFVLVGGYLMDVTGSFVSAFYLGGALIFASVLSISALPLVKKFRKRDRKITCTFINQEKV